MYTSGPGEASFGASRLLNTPILGAALAGQVISIIKGRRGSHAYGNARVLEGVCVCVMRVEFQGGWRQLGRRTCVGAMRHWLFSSPFGPPPQPYPPPHPSTPLWGRREGSRERGRGWAEHDGERVCSPRVRRGLVSH